MWYILCNVVAQRKVCVLEKKYANCLYYLLLSTFLYIMDHNFVGVLLDTISFLIITQLSQGSLENNNNDRLKVRFINLLQKLRKEVNRQRDTFYSNQFRRWTRNLKKERKLISKVISSKKKRKKIYSKNIPLKYN